MPHPSSLLFTIEQYTAPVQKTSADTGSGTESISQTSMGNLTVETANDDSQAIDLVQINRHSTGVGGKISKAVGYISGQSFGSGNQQIRAVVYADSAGAPGALLGYSDTITVVDGTPYAWTDFPFSQSIILPPSTFVWIGYHGGANSDTIQMRYGNVTNAGRFATDTFSDGPANPFPSSSNFSGPYSLYVVLQKPQLVTKIPSSDTGSGVDSGVATSGAVSKTSSDTGNGTDIAVIKARVASAQTGAGADTGVAAVGRIFKTSADTGSGTDTVLKRKSQVLETSAGADTQVLTKARLASTDSGSGVDSVSKRKIASFDSCGGVDSQALSIGVVPKASSDSGSGVDAGVPKARVASVDSKLYDPQTVLLIHANGADGSTTFTDSSQYAHPITANGNVQVDVQAPSLSFNQSALFDGSLDYLSIPDSSVFDFGAGDFTIDCWVRWVSGSGQIIYGKRAVGANFGHVALYVSGSAPAFVATFDNATWTVVFTGSASFTGNWDHLAVVRSGNTWTLYLNGVSVGSQTVAGTVATNTDSVKIGSDTDGASFNGWIDEIRVSKGVARWTSNFTPPAAPYPNVGVNGVDTQTVKLSKTSADTGSGSDAGVPRARVASTQTGIGTDTQATIGATTPKPSADTGAGTETQLVRVRVTSTDSGTGADTVLKRKIASADSGTGVEAQLARPRITSSDAGADVETATAKAKITSADVGSGADTVTQRKIRTPDSGTGADAIPKRKIASSDSGAGVDAVSKIKVTSNDSGVGTEAVLKRKVASADSGIGVDTASSQTPNNKTSAQTGVGTDSAVVRIRVASVQTATGAELQALVAKLASAQVGSGTDTGVITKRAYVSIQLGAGADTQTLKARVTSNDTGSGTDTQFRRAKYASSDAGVGTDTATQSHAVNADLTCNFQVRALTRSDLICTFAVVSGSKADLIGVYNITGIAGASLTCVYTLTGPVRTDLVVVYRIFGAAPIIAGIITRPPQATATLEQVLDTEGIITKAATGKVEFEIVEKAQGIVTRSSPAKVKERVYA